MLQGMIMQHFIEINCDNIKELHVKADDTKKAAIIASETAFQDQSLKEKTAFICESRNLG